MDLSSITTAAASRERKPISAHLTERTSKAIPSGEAEQCPKHPRPTITRKKLIDLLNEDLAREYQAIIAYVNYSQVLKGAEYMNIAAELAVHANEELAHAITSPATSTISAACPPSNPSPSRPPRRPPTCSASTSTTRRETIANYRRRVKQCDELNEFALSESIREILMQEQDHLQLPSDSPRHRSTQPRHRGLAHSEE